MDMLTIYLGNFVLHFPSTNFKKDFHISRKYENGIRLQLPIQYTAQSWKTTGKQFLQEIEFLIFSQIFLFRRLSSLHSIPACVGVHLL